MSETPIKIALVDDHPIVRSGIRALLRTQADIEVVAEAGTCAQAIETVTQTQPDVVVLDLRLPDGPGLDVARHIFDNGLQARCVVLTSVPTDRALISAFDTGAVMAFLAKDADITPLVSAIREVAAGRSLLDAFTVRDASNRLDEYGANRVHTLSKRELEVAGLVASGMSDAHIARECSVSVSTVRNALSSTYAKLECDTRTQLARLVWMSRTDADVV